MPKKGGLGQFADLREAWQKRGKWVLLRGLVGGGVIPNTHYKLGNNFNFDFNLLMPMSSLLISNKKYYLAIDWLLTITVDVVRR